MLLRAYALIVLTLICTGCAGQGFAPSTLETGALQAAPSMADGEAIAAGEKTMAAKVLTAIALERSTGRAPDPARLDELN